MISSHPISEASISIIFNASRSGEDNHENSFTLSFIFLTVVVQAGLHYEGFFLISHIEIWRNVEYFYRNLPNN